MILIVAEHRDGRLLGVTRELVTMGLGMGRELEVPVVALVVGADVAGLAKTLASWQVDRVIEVESEKLGARSPELLAAVVGAVIDKEGPSYVVAGHTSEGIEFLPRLAVRRERSLIAGCVGYERHGDRLLLVRPIFNSKLHMRVAPRGEAPWFLTLAPGSVPTDALEEGPGVVPEKFDPAGADLSDVSVRRHSVALEAAAKGEVSLDGASVIVAVGRGIQKAENISIVQELAAAFGAPLGASRPVVDSGWLPRDRQIGSSGQTVSPRLYVAVGISGAIQHLVGMQSSQCIVAINKDGEAPVFKVAHYGIAGDLFEIVPELTRLVQELKGASAAGE